MKNTPCAILIVTADVKQSAARVFEAISYGALDAVNTPILGNSHSPEMAQSLLHKIATIEKLIPRSTLQGRGIRPISIAEEMETTNRMPRPYPSSQSSASIRTHLPHLRPDPYLIAIGASTGGPKTLATLLSPLPADFDAAILIVQHIDAQFAGGLIDWLSHQTTLRVKKAEVGDRPARGTVLVACTDHHLAMQFNHTLTYIKEPIHYPYRPSVDVLFRSLARCWQPPGTAILLTGMGRDGAEGLNLLHSQGWYTIAQNEASSVVYGMPKAAVELHAATVVWSPQEIVNYLLQKVPAP